MTQGKEFWALTWHDYMNAYSTTEEGGCKVVAYVEDAAVALLRAVEDGMAGLTVWRRDTRKALEDIAKGADILAGMTVKVTFNSNGVGGILIEIESKEAK